jgi:hypothetical protein
MPQTRFTLSPLGREIIGDVESFIKANAHSFIPGEKPTPDDGSKMLAHAICYAIAKALGSQSFNAALKAGICPGTVPGTAGALISTALIIPTKEL